MWRSCCFFFFYVWGGLQFGCTSIFFGHGLRVRSCDRPPSRGLILRKRRPGAGTTVLFALEVAKLAPAYLFYKWILAVGLLRAGRRLVCPGCRMP